MVIVIFPTFYELKNDFFVTKFYQLLKMLVGLVESSRNVQKNEGAH